AEVTRERHSQDHGDQNAGQTPDDAIIPAVDPIHAGFPSRGLLPSDVASKQTGCMLGAWGAWQPDPAETSQATQRGSGCERLIRKEQSMTAGYTEREWQFLIRQGDWDWPDTWETLSRDLDHWRPGIERICRGHGIPFDGRFRAEQGSNVAFLVGGA